VLALHLPALPARVVERFGTWLALAAITAAALALVGWAVLNGGG
jgi:hypothetical protein